MDWRLSNETYEAQVPVKPSLKLKVPVSVEPKVVQQFIISKRVQSHKQPQIDLGCHERVPGLLQPEKLILDGSQ